MYSKNKKYVAKIIGKKEESPFKRVTEFTLNVYSVKNKRLQWSSPYSHTGYFYTWVSNNGDIVVHINSFHLYDNNLIYIYKNGLVKTISLKDLKISKQYLHKTESHELWIADKDCGVEDEKSIVFVDEKGVSPAIIVAMRNGKVLTVDLSTLKYDFKDYEKKMNCSKPKDILIE